MSVDALYVRTGGQVAVEAAGVVDLGDQAEISEGRRIAVAAEACRHRASEQGFHVGQASLDQVEAVSRGVGLREAEVATQDANGPEVLQRLNLAGDRQRDLACARAAGWLLGKQRRLRVLLLEVLENREALAHHQLTVFQRRDESLGIAREPLVSALLAPTQVHEVTLEGQSLPVERDPHAVGARGAKVCVELHARSTRRRRPRRVGRWRQRSTRPVNRTSRCEPDRQSA